MARHTASPGEPFLAWLADNNGLCILRRSFCFPRRDSGASVPKNNPEAGRILRRVLDRLACDFRGSKGRSSFGLSPVHGVCGNSCFPYHLLQVAVYHTPPKCSLIYIKERFRYSNLIFSIKSICENFIFPNAVLAICIWRFAGQFP